MNAFKIYHGISAIFTFVTLVLLFTTDISYLADKAKLFVIISMFGSVELFKYFVTSCCSPDILKALCPPTQCQPIRRHSFDKKLNHIMKVVTLISAMTMLYHIAIILLGAGVSEKFEETFLLSVLLCILTFLPLCLYCEPVSCIRAVFDADPYYMHSFEVTLRQSLYITLFGAWVGAFVIPLDWDRPWQKWPIPCTVGAMLGYCISHIIKLLTPYSKYSV